MSLRTITLGKKHFIYHIPLFHKSLTNICVIKIKKYVLHFFLYCLQSSAVVLKIVWRIFFFKTPFPRSCISSHVFCARKYSAYILTQKLNYSSTINFKCSRITRKIRPPPGILLVLFHVKFDIALIASSLKKKILIKK